MEYKIEMIDSEDSTTIVKIKEFENDIGVSLPREYKEFLLEYNGGHPIKDTYDLMEPINSVDLEADIAWFFALYDGEVCNLQRHYEIFKNNKPEELLPIGYGSGGDNICLCVRGKNYGKVYFWDVHNQASDGKEPWWDNVYLIANSFREFIDKLYEAELDENNNLVRVERE